MLFFNLKDWMMLRVAWVCGYDCVYECDVFIKVHGVLPKVQKSCQEE